jgi:hypothetical protein
MDNDTKPTIILVTDSRGPPALPCLKFFFYVALATCTALCTVCHDFDFPYAIINKDFDIEYPKMCYRMLTIKRDEAETYSFLLFRTVRRMNGDDVI